MTTVKVYALSAGFLTLPEKHFISPASDTDRRTVPSLSFLIRYKDPKSHKQVNILFDLGIRRDTAQYTEPIQRHIKTRQPLSTDPDVVKSLTRGGLVPEDVSYIIYSHAHWDHWGMPQDFPNSTFVVGPGTLKLLRGEHPDLRGSHSHFERDLPLSRLIELLAPRSGKCETGREDIPTIPDFMQEWTPLGELPEVIDVLRDGSLYVVNAPGHLPGHINLLARTSTGSIYLAGDACHDRRLLTREKSVAEWEDGAGMICCIHANRPEAEHTLARIRELERRGTEVILSHDEQWERDPANRS